MAAGNTLSFLKTQRLLQKYDLTVFAARFECLDYQAALATEVLYNPAVACVKISCLLLYRRIFPNHRFRIILWIIGTIVFLYNWVVLFLAIFQCQPIQATWDPSIQGAKCIKFNIIGTAFAVVNSITDVVTCLLPLPMLWGLQLPKSKKVQLMAIFLLCGLYVQSLSCYRVLPSFPRTPISLGKRSSMMRQNLRM